MNLMGRKIDVEDLLDSAQVSTELGLSSSTGISVYRSRYPDFPPPVVNTGRCMLWARRDVDRWRGASRGSRRVRTDRAERQQFLAMIVRRSIFGLRAQRERLLEVDHPAGHDLDFYAHSAWQMREAIRQGVRRVGIDALRPVLESIDQELPELHTYRDAMTHAVDDRTANWAWFGSFAARLMPSGRVEYLLDARHHHERLESIGRQALDILDPNGELDADGPAIDAGRPAPS